MKRKDLADLLSRARAAIEDPDALEVLEQAQLEEDLTVAERALRPGGGGISE